MRFDPGYAAIMSLAIAVAWWLRRFLGNSPSLTLPQRSGLLFAAFCGSMIGAKFPYLWRDWSTLISGEAWLRDGKTILAGLAGGYLAIELAKWCLEIRQKTGDSFAAPVAAAIAIGRWGCFHAGCCYGRPTEAPWAVVFHHVDAVPRHPTQIYESIFHAACVVVIVTIIRTDYRGCESLRNHLTKAYIIAYAVYRMATEIIRPEPRIIGPITAYQIAAAAIAALMIAFWIRDVMTQRRQTIVNASEPLTR